MPSTVLIFGIVSFVKFTILSAEFELILKLTPFIFALLFGFFNLDYSEFLGKFFLKLLKFRNVKVNNIELFNKVFKSDRKCLIIANHRCLFDVHI